MLAYKLLGTSGNEMLAVSNNKTEHFTQAQEGLFTFEGRLIGSIIPKLQTGVSPSDRKITCTILNVKDADKIKAFFDKIGRCFLQTFTRASTPHLTTLLTSTLRELHFFSSPLPTSQREPFLARNPLKLKNTKESLL